MQYTLGEDLLENPWQIDVIQGKLTRNLDAIIPDLADELQVALQDVVPSKGEGEFVFRCRQLLECTYEAWKTGSRLMSPRLLLCSSPE